MNCSQCKSKLRRKFFSPDYDYLPVVKGNQDKPESIQCTISIQYECIKCGADFTTNNTINYKEGN